MRLPKRKLEQIEYYEVYKKENSYEMGGKPVQKNKIIIHFKDQEETVTFLGIPLWTRTVEGETKTFTFTRNRNLQNPKADEGERLYTFSDSEPFKKLHTQLEAYFDSEFQRVYQELKRHEIEYIT